jgi:hypothetical protein
MVFDLPFAESMAREGREASGGGATRGDSMLSTPVSAEHSGLTQMSAAVPMQR